MLLQKRKRYLISALIFAVLFLGTIVGFILLKNSQDVRQQASDGCKAGEPYCSCDMWGGNCVLVNPEGVRKIIDQGSLENNKGIIATSFTGERPTTGDACGGVWMNEFCYMPGDEIAGGYIVVDSGRYDYPYLEKKTTYESLGFGGETIDNKTGTVESLGEDCGGSSYRIGNNCYAFGAVVNGYVVMPNRTSDCDNSTGDYCYAHLKKIEVSYNDWQQAVDNYEKTGNYTKLEELYKKIYGIPFQPGSLYNPQASNADLLRAQALISSLTSAEVLQKNAQEENRVLEEKGNLSKEEQAIYDFNKRIIDYPDLAKHYQVLDQLNDATSQKITINNAISQMYSDLVIANGDANLNNLAKEKFKEIFGYDPSGKYGNLNGILGAFGIDPTQLNKDRTNYANTLATATEKQNQNIDKLNQEYQEYVSGQSSNINDLKQAALDAGLITESEIRGKSEQDLLALLLSKFSDISLADAKKNADAIVSSRTNSVREQELIRNYIGDQDGANAKDNLLELYKLYVGHSPTYRMTTSELEREIAKHNSQIALSLYAQTKDVSYLNNYFTTNFPNAPASQISRVMGDPELLLDTIYGSVLGGELYQDIVLPQKFNEAVANFSSDSGASLISVCKDMGISNCNINSSNATDRLAAMLTEMYGEDASVNISELATSYSNQIYTDTKSTVFDKKLESMGTGIQYSSASNPGYMLGEWLGNLLGGNKNAEFGESANAIGAEYSEIQQELNTAYQASDIFNPSQAFKYATANKADLSDYTWGLSYGNALMADNIFNREFTINDLGLNTGQTISLTFNQLTSQIANVDVAQNIATNYATSRHYGYTGPADTRIADIALRGANNINLNDFLNIDNPATNNTSLLGYNYQPAETGYYTDKTLRSWGESIGEAMTYLGASYASSQMNQMALNQSLYTGNNNFEFTDPVAYAQKASAEFKASYQEDMVNDLYEKYIATADIQNVNKLSFEQFINDPEIKRSSQELNYERLEKVVAPAAAIVVLPAMMLTGVGAPIILGAASSVFSLYQGAGMKGQSLELQRIDIESRENAIVQSYIDSGASDETINQLKVQLDEQVDILNKQGNLMLANSAVAALTSFGGWATTIGNVAKLSGTTVGNIALNSGQVLTKMGQIGGIGLNTYNTFNSGVTAFNAFEQGNTWEGITSGIGAFVSASGVAGNTFGVFGPTAFTNKIDYVLDAMNVPAGAGMDLQQVSQACFSGSDAFSEKDCTNAWIGLALSMGQNVSQVSSSYKNYRNDTDVARLTDLQKQIDAIDLEIIALGGPNKNISSGLQINDLVLQRSTLIDQIARINPDLKIANLNSNEDYLANSMRISLDLENQAQKAIENGQDQQALYLIEQAANFRNKPIEIASLRDRIDSIDEQVKKNGLSLSNNELTNLQQNRNDLVNKLENLVKDLSAVESMQKQNEIVLQTVKADTAFQELNRLLAIDAQKVELVRTYSPSNEAVAKYRTELNPDAETIKLETDADGRLKSLAVLEDSLSKLTDLETQRQALLNTSNADSEVGREAIAKLDAEIAPLQKIVDGFSTNNRSFFQRIADAISPNKASREAYYKSLDLTREIEIARAKLTEAEQNGSTTHALKEQLADINRQLVEQKYILAQDLLNPSKNFVQRIAEFIPNLGTNRQIADLKTAARKLGTANLEIAEQIANKQAEIEKLRTEDATKNQAKIDELEKQIVDLSKTARNLLKGNNALMKVDQTEKFTKYIITEAGEKAGIKQKQLDILNDELAKFEDFMRQGQTEEQRETKPWKIYSGTDSFKDQDIFLLAELEAFGAGRRGTVFGALPGMGKTDVVMPFNILLKQRLTNEPQFIVFPEPKLMKPWTSDASYTPNKAFIDYVETNFGKGSVLIVRANDPNVDPLAIARAKFVITTKDVAFDLQNTSTSVGLALRNKWKNSFVHADEVDWTFNPNENYKVSGSQVALRDKPEFDLYLNAQKSVLGIDEKGNLSGKGLSSLRNLINQLETSKSIPDGIVRTSDGKGGKFADADLEKQVLSEWLGTWGGRSKISDLDMSADISVIREKINNYLSTDTDAQTHNHRAELAMINETVNFLSRVPGEDYGVSSNTRMNGDVEETINSIAPKEQNRDTGRSYSAVAESLLYNTLGARILGANSQIDLSKLTVGENGSEINYALLMLESKGFSLYTGTPETVAKLYQMAYGIELKVFTDSAVDDSIARFKDSDSELFTDLESQIKTRLAENKDQVFINMVSGLRSNEVALNDLVTKISTVDVNNQTYKKLILIGASGKLAEYDLVDGNLQYVRDFASTDDLNNRTAELNGKKERYIKFYEYGAHVGVDTKNNVDTSRAIGLCNGCDATTFAQGINRVRVQVETLATGGSVTKSAPMDVVWLDAPAGIKNPNIDDFATAIKDRQTINEALAEVYFKETLLKNSVDATFADLIELARNGKKGFLGLGAYRTNQDLVAQLEMAQQKWKETTQMNYMLGSDDLSAQRKLEKTASQVAGAYEELNKLLVGSGEPAKLLAKRADGAIGNNKLQLAFSGDENYKVLGERPSYRQIVELINQSSKHLENVDIAFTNRSSQTEVVQSEIAKAGEAQTNVVVRNNEENVNQNIFRRTAETINQRFNSTNFQKIIRTPITLISSAYSAIVDFFSEEEISPEVLAQRDKAINDLKITNEDTLIALDDLKTEEEINNFIKERQLAYQALRNQFSILNTVKPAINNEEDYKTQESKFNEIITEIETLQRQSGLNFIEINENGEISRVNEDQFKNLSTFRAKAEIQIEKLAKQTEAERLLAEQKAIEEAKKLEQEKLEQEQLAKEASDKAKAEEEQKAKLALEEAEKLKQAEEKAAIELAKAKEAEQLALEEANKLEQEKLAHELMTEEENFSFKVMVDFFTDKFDSAKNYFSNIFNLNQDKTKTTATIGRSLDSSLRVIPGLTTVSRRHASILRNNNLLYIRDLSSTNGTYINNQKIDPEVNVLLNEGDVVFLGNPDSLGITFTVIKDKGGQLHLKSKNNDLLADNSSIFQHPSAVENLDANAPQNAFLDKLKTSAVILDLNPSEISFFNKAKKDSKQPQLTRKLLNQPELIPKKKIIIEGITYYFLTDILKTGNGTGYSQVIMYSIDQDKRIIPRSLYKSNSDGGWRSTPYFAAGIYSKDHGVVYTQETKVHDQLNNILNEMEMNGSSIVVNEDIIKANFDIQTVLENGLNTFTSEVKIYDDAGVLAEFQKYPPGHYDDESNVPSVEDIRKLTYPDGFIPDFTQDPFLVENVNHTLLGPTILRKYMGQLNNRPVVWVMATDSANRIWIDRIYFADSKLTSYGVYDEVINSGILTNKPLEYASQAYYLDQNYKKSFNGKYVDITPILANLLPIEQYRNALQERNKNKYQELSDKIAVFVENYSISSEEEYKSALEEYNRVLPATLELQKNSGITFIEENNGIFYRSADWIGRDYEEFFSQATEQLVSHLLSQSKYYGQEGFQIIVDNDELDEIFSKKGFAALKEIILEKIKQREKFYELGGAIGQASEFINSFTALQNLNQISNISGNQLIDYINRASQLINLLENENLSAHSFYEQIKQASIKLNAFLQLQSINNQKLDEQTKLSLINFVSIVNKLGLNLQSAYELGKFYEVLLQRPNFKQEIENLIRVSESKQSNIASNLEGVTTNTAAIPKTVPTELFEGSDGYKTIFQSSEKNAPIAMDFYQTLRNEVFSLILSEQGLAFNENNTEQYLEKISQLNNWTEYIKNHLQTTLDDNEQQVVIDLVKKALIEDLFWIRKEKFDEILFSSLFIDKPFFDGLILTGDKNVAHAYDTFGQSTRAGDVGAWDSWINAYDINFSELNLSNLQNLHKTIFAWYDDPDTNPSKKNDRAGILRDINDQRDKEPLYAKDYQDGSPLVLTQAQIDNLKNLKSLRSGVNEPIMKFVYADGINGPNEDGLYVGYIEFCKTIDVEQELEALMQWHNEVSSRDHDPYLLAAELQQRFIAIHPFRDGNGRTSRWLMNWSLKKDGLNSSIIYDTDKDMFSSVEEWAEEIKKGEIRFKSLKDQMISMIEKGIPSNMITPQIEIEGTETWDFHQWTQFSTFVKSNPELLINKLVKGNKLNRDEFYNALKEAVMNFLLYQIISVKSDFGGLIDPYYAMSYTNTNPQVQKFLRTYYAENQFVRRGAYNKLDTSNRFTSPRDILSFFHSGQDDLITTNGTHKTITAKLYNDIKNKSVAEQRLLIAKYLSEEIGNHGTNTSGSDFYNKFPDLIVNSVTIQNFLDEIIQVIIESRGFKVPNYFAQHAAQIYNYMMLDIFNEKSSSVSKQVISGHISANSWWSVSPFTSYSKNETTPKDFSIGHLSDGNVNAAFVITSALPSVGALYDQDYQGVYAFHSAGVNYGYTHEGEVLFAGGQNLSLIENIEMWMRDSSDGTNYLASKVERFGEGGNSLRLTMYDKKGAIISSEIHRFNQNGLLELVSVINDRDLNKFENFESEISELQSLINQLNFGDPQAKFDSYTGQGFSLPISIDANGYNVINAFKFTELKNKLQLILNYRKYLLNGDIKINLTDNPSFEEAEKRFKEALQKAGLKYEPLQSKSNVFSSLCSDCNQVRLTTQAGVEKADALTRESEALLQQAEEAKNNNDANKAQDLTTQAEAKKQEALKQLNDTRFQVVNSHGMQNQCVQLYLNAWVDTREALIRKTRADIDNAIDSVYKATVLAEKMMDSKQIEIKTNTIFGFGGEIIYQPLSDGEVDEIGDLLFGNEAKNIEGLQSWATFDLGEDGKFSRTVLKGSLLNLDNTVVTSQVSPIRVFLRKFAISSRQMILLDNLKTTLSSYLNEETEYQIDVSVTPTISITVSPTPSVTPTPEPISPTPSIVPVSSDTQNNINWHLILNIIGTTLSLTLFGSILGHLPIFAAPQLPKETPTAIVEEVKKEESVLVPEITSTPTPSPTITSTPIPIPTIEEVIEMKIEVEEKEEVIFFNQLDDRWKNIQIDKNTRFGNVGCGPVSVANLTGISPEQVLKFYELGSAMGITDKGTGIEANEAALKKLGYKTSTGINGNGVLEDEIRRANSRNDYKEVIHELKNYQKNGDWKIMLNGNFGNLSGGGHWVVVTEVNVDTNTITVIDPNGGELKEYILDTSGNSDNDNAIAPKKILLAKKV